MAEIEFDHFTRLNRQQWVFNTARRQSIKQQVSAEHSQ